MLQRNPMTNLIAATLIVSVPALALPVSAGAAPAGLSGALVHAADQTPLVGAKLHVGNPETGKIVTADPADDHGAFRVSGLEPATYELAVETAGGLYLVGTPVRLAPGQVRTLNVAVAATAAASDDDDDQPGAAAAPTKTSLWENPLTAALIVLGAAIVVGYVVDQATDDDDESTASPS